MVGQHAILVEFVFFAGSHPDQWASHYDDLGGREELPWHTVQHLMRVHKSGEVVTIRGRPVRVVAISDIQVRQAYTTISFLLEAVTPITG